MKKLYAMLPLMAGVVLSASAQSKFDAQSLMVMDAYRTLKAIPDASVAGIDQMPVDIATLQSRSGAKAGAFISIDRKASASHLEALGLEIVDDLGDMVLASGTLEQFDAAAKCNFVRHISFGEKRVPYLDRSRVVTSVDKVHDGIDLPNAYKGAGVIAGIYDTGLDPNHANFLDADMNPRASIVWSYTNTNGDCTTYNTPDAIKLFKTEAPNATHGTHTLGCMAGSNTRNNTYVVVIDDETGQITKSTVVRKIANPYYGMAPEATLAVGCGALYDSNIAMAVKRTAEYAKAQGKPGVMNLSIGSMFGPHDGTDAVCRYMEKYGKDIIIFIAAGNDGDANTTFDKTFSAGDKTFATFFPNNGNLNGSVDLWSASSETFTVTPVVYDLNTKSVLWEYPVDGSEEGTVTIASSTVAGNTVKNDAFDKAFRSSSVSLARSKNTGGNGRYQVRMSVNLTYNNETNPGSKIVLGFRITGQANQRVMAVSNCKFTNEYPAEFVSYGIDGYNNGTADWTINSMACGKNTVCVGAWSGRTKWPVLFPTTISYADQFAIRNEVTPFSSYGKAVDGTPLPHVVAPGTGIISSISTYYVDKLKTQLGTDFESYVNSNFSANQKINNRQNYYECQQGTSMATPIVAGGVALWLQADPTLTVDRVKEIIAATAVKDEYYNSGLFPKLKWGAGKFNAYAGLKMVLGNSGVDNVVADGGSNLVLTSTGRASWEVLVPGSQAVEAALFNMQGACVALDKAPGNCLNLDAEHLPAGVYILKVNNTLTSKIVVR